jgi:diaminopimelate decarboxylase
MIPQGVLRAILENPLPCFVYDTGAVRNRVNQAVSLVDRYFFPIKACPEPELLRAVLGCTAGLDLCSRGDLEIAESLNSIGHRLKFTSPHAEEALLRRLVAADALLDADSAEQALEWKRCGGKACGLRITAKQPKALYGVKFGIPAAEAGDTAQQLALAGLTVEGLHIHDQHDNCTPSEFPIRVADSFSAVDPGLLKDCRYINIGGSWPTRYGTPATVERMRGAMIELRRNLSALGFKGELYSEPGRWVVGPCGYWAARVISIKPHPEGPGRRIVVLDTSTPVPCRPSLSPFAVVRDGQVLRTLDEGVRCDIFGSANTALDTMGIDVRLPSIALEDVVVSFGQGAYTRALIPPFNERERPGAMVASATSRDS